ncbi:MAG: hypothetical protein ACE5E5_13660 [Phycisphaerae bacterium]
MHVIQHTAEQIQTTLKRMPPKKVSQLRAGLRRLRWEHFNFIRETLDHARAKRRSPIGHLRFLEDHFQEWRKHDLATKLAIIHCVTNQFDSRTWPGDAPEDHAVREVMASADATDQAPAPCIVRSG